MESQVLAVATGDQAGAGMKQMDESGSGLAD
jgi:hypothetical protein